MIRFMFESVVWNVLFDAIDAICWLCFDPTGRSRESAGNNLKFKRFTKWLEITKGISYFHRICLQLSKHVHKLRHINTWLFYQIQMGSKEEFSPITSQMCLNWGLSQMNVIIPMHWHATLTCCRDDDDFWNSRSELQIFSNCIEKGPQKTCSNGHCPNRN